MDDDTCAPNHHAGHRPFTGPFGFVAMLMMIAGREPDAALAARLSGLRPGETVVDVGCGPGTAARRAARLGATVTGVDPARIMRRTAQLMTRKAAVQWIDGAAEALPLPDDTANVVWSIATVHHWADVDAGLREVRRILRPGGRFVAIERHTRPGARGLAGHGWTDAQAEAFADRARAAGFADVRVEHATGRRPALAVVAQ
ncbi:MAG TPA: class I SAM-dependent methyltransferase [Acidimicrobiia bacterium]|nr:class I SAM-dependent methyltransferase [Acidimicrobiia bacterium]